MVAPAARARRSGTIDGDENVRVRTIRAASAISNTTPSAGSTTGVNQYAATPIGGGATHGNPKSNTARTTVATLSHAATPCPRTFRHPFVVVMSISRSLAVAD
jgi:hypothetical protein